MTTRDTVRAFQRAYNTYTADHGLSWLRLDVDGSEGPKTRAAERQMLLMLGFTPRQVREHAAGDLAHIVAFVKDRGRHLHPRRIARGLGYRRRLRKGHKTHGVTAARQRALDWLEAHRGLTEQPAGSNSDTRRDGIAAAQRRCANGAHYLDYAPWCGVAVWAALEAAGVKGISSRQAAVAFIEDDAKAGRAPYRSWSTDPRSAKPGDSVVLFGRGTHVGTVKEVRNGYLTTLEGNTSPEGGSGSQANGGGLFQRTRAFGLVRGIAHVRFPGE